MLNKLGRLILCFVPLVVTLIFQTIIAIPVMVVYLIKDMAEMANNSGGVVNITPEFFMNPEFLTPVNLTTLVYYNFFAAIGFGLFYYLVMKDKYKASVKETFGVPSVLGILLLFVGFEGIVSSVMLVLQNLIPKAFEAYTQLIEQSGLAQLSLVSTLAAVVLAPISEEIIFRGITFKLARKFSAKFWVANTIQALAFGIAHMNLIQGTYAFVMGLILGVVYKKFHSLIATMIAHLAFNFAGTWLESLIYGADTQVNFLKAGIVCACAVILTVGGFLMIAKYRKTPSNESRFDLEYAYENPQVTAPVSE